MRRFFPAHDISPRLRYCLCGNRGAEPNCSIWHTLYYSGWQLIWDSEDTMVNLYIVVFRGQTEKPHSVLWSLFLTVFFSSVFYLGIFYFVNISQKPASLECSVRLPQFQLHVMKKLVYFIAMRLCCGVNYLGSVLMQSFSLKWFYLWSK